MSIAEETLNDFLDSAGNPALFGGPSSVEVAIDVGQSGPRGSFFFFSDGDPNDLTKKIWATFSDKDISGDDKRLYIPSQKFSLFIQRNDVCINVGPGDAGYLRIYHYSDGNQGTRWYPILSASPPGISAIFPITFSSGTGFLTLAGPFSQNAPAILTDILALQAGQSGFDLATYLGTLNVLVAAILNFQINVQSTNPAAVSIFPNPTANPSAGTPIEFFYSQEPGDAIYSATLSSNLSTPNLVLMTAGNTRGFVVGEKVSKHNGAGAFGTDTIITKILSDTAFEVSKPHTTSGAIGFKVSILKFNAYYFLKGSEFSGSIWSDINSQVPIHFIVGVGQIPGS